MANDIDGEFDPFAFDSGFIDDVDAEILDAWFAFDPLYNNGQTLRLYLDCMTDDTDFGEMGRGELRPYSCGDGWTAEDKGAVAVRNDGANKAFNRNAGIAKLVNAMLDCDGVEDILRSEGRGDPRRASCYIGLKFHFKNKEFDYGGEIGKRDMLLPTEFLGVSGDTTTTTTAAPGPVAGVAKKAPGAPVNAPAKSAGPVKKASGTTAAAPAAAIPAPAPAAWTPPLEGSPQYQQIYDIAYSAESHEKFVEGCYEQVEGIMESDELAEWVMAAGEGSVWAKAVADYEAAN